MKKVDAILCSDIHLRETQPTCRTDDFWKAQWQAIDYVASLQEKYNCVVLHAGDLFHHWKPSPYLLSTTIKHLPKQFYTILGQHDLPQHSFDLFDKCGVNTLQEAGKVEVLKTCHWGQTPTKEASFLFPDEERKILVWHHMTYIVAPFPGAQGGQALSLLKKYPQFDLIVTGDNHQTFTEQYKGRLLVNPGSLTRQTAAQINHKPCVFLYRAEDNTVEQVFLPIKQGVISREHIEIEEKRDMRIQAFVERLDTEWKSGVSFEDNLEKFFNKNTVKKDVQELVWKATA